MSSNSDAYEIRRIFEGDVRASDTESVRGLLSQLRRKKQPAITLKNLQACVRESIFVVVFGHEGTIVGMARIVKYHGFHHYVGEVGDVVVDEAERGKGLGEKLMREILRLAAEEKLSFLTLTSNEARAAAHSLYEKLGFKKGGETTRFYLPLVASS